MSLGLAALLSLRPVLAMLDWYFLDLILVGVQRMTTYVVQFQPCHEPGSHVLSLVYCGCFPERFLDEFLETFGEVVSRGKAPCDARLIVFHDWYIPMSAPFSYGFISRKRFEVSRFFMCENPMYASHLHTCWCRYM